jgi:aminopeptidase YwaD
MLLALIVSMSVFATGQKAAPGKAASAQPQTKATSWTVKPEWVRADEGFLASDALLGRGSATRDEEIAARFVASQFESFGLKPAAPDGSFIEKVELITPKLDGKAQIAANGTALNEGQDFYLLTSSGESASGKLVKLTAADIGKAHIAPGSAVLLTGGSDDPRRLFQAAQRLRGSANIILVQDSPAMKQVFEHIFDNKTRVPMRVKDVEGPGAMGRSGNNVVLTNEAFAKLSALSDGADLSLAVHPLPQSPVNTYNAIGKIEGSDPAAGAVLLSAHLDHLGVRADQSGGDHIYNGADDDAAGTTAVIELARGMASMPRPTRTVYFACFGSEETGGQGDDYFRNHPPVPLDQVVANIEFEMIGAQDPKMPKGVLLLTGWERSDLGPTMKEHGAKIGPDPYPEQHFFERSDNYGLALKGVVAHTAAGWGTPPYYHRPDDDLAHLDFGFMTEAIQSFVAPLEWLANSDFKPKWNEGGQPKR